MRVARKMIHVSAEGPGHKSRSVYSVKLLKKGLFEWKFLFSIKKLKAVACISAPFARP